MVEYHGCNRLPRIEIADAEGENLIRLERRSGRGIFFFSFLFSSYLDNFVIYPIVPQSEQDVINHVRHLFEDCHYDEREHLPQEAKRLHNAVLIEKRREDL